MTEVQLSPNDRDDILELLDYALEKKLEEEPTRYGKYKWDNRGYYKLRIPQLKRLIRGEKIYNDIRQSSMGGLVKDIIEGLEDEANY